MKIFYALALTLFLISGILVVFPPRTTLAANCSANCETGEVISIKGAISCTCMDNVGCVWRRDGKAYARKFAEVELCLNSAFGNDH